ncbi:MAG: DUF885 family protein [Erysipelotrichaceae bacterium]|uniref:DUF885 family protein n=1 Tax=Floccifex sp. TaxID=2815810 RepID=UPI002A761434|nr:DUF885 family protein [Floccifex sp.]MDD7281326.1 DUF885 family protein [Erysipelotrichaceae bacterium]MDY2958911.1 DUF885 family protein [Floccifex sp.]
MKKLLSIILSLCLLSGCTTKVEGPNKQFIDFCNDYFINEMESDYTTMHQYLENPKDYGVDVDRVEISLGHVNEDTTKQVEQTLDDLKSFKYNDLDTTQKVIYDELEKELNWELKMNDEKFMYTTNILSSMGGIHENLITFFSEYVLRNEKDIQDLLILIEDTPRYMDEVIAYIKEQANQNMLRFDYDTVTSSIQETLASKDNSSITKELQKEVDTLSIENKDSYKKQISDSIQQYVFPAYQSLLDTIVSLKDKVQPVTGLYNTENGLEYYELLVEKATGTTTSIEDIQEQLQDALTDVLYNYTYTEYETDPISTTFNSAEEILTFLNDNYKSYFPEVKDMNYELTPLDDDQSTDGIVAYFVIPSLDNTLPYQIRYNQRDYGKDTTDIELYTTLAHEGITGHMYQAQYNAENLEYPIQFLFDNSGLAEGYATYAQIYALNYLDLTTTGYKLESEMNFYLTALLDIEINYNGLTLDELNSQYGMDMSTIYNQVADNPTTFLSYYYGYLQILNLKDQKMSDMDFHNNLLKYGNVYFDVLKKHM